MARSTAFTQRGRQAPKRLTQWGLGPGGTGVVAIASSASSLLGGGVQFGASGTVVRIRGWFDAFLTGYTSAGDGFQGAVGIGLVSTAAFTAGIASVPTPIIEAAWDGWLWHQFFGVHGQLAAGSTSVGTSGPGVSREIDSKAMRKVSDEMTVYAVVEVVEIGTGLLSVHLDSRLLLKLG